MSADERTMVLAAVAVSPLSKSLVLAELGIPRRTYYNWVKRQREGRLGDGDSGSRIPWNRLRSEEQNAVVAEARAAKERAIKEKKVWSKG